MDNGLEIIKSRKLKVVRGLMYLDALLLLLNFSLLALHEFALCRCLGVCLRILVFLGIFAVLLATEKSLSCCLRKGRNGKSP